jgi:hypothetical protein
LKTTINVKLSVLASHASSKPGTRHGACNYSTKVSKGRIEIIKKSFLTSNFSLTSTFRGRNRATSFEEHAYCLSKIEQELVVSTFRKKPRTAAVNKNVSMLFS